MPTLSMDAPVLAKMRASGWRINRLLPDVEEVYSRSLGIVSPGYLGAESALQSAMIYQESSQYGLGAILQNVGMPVYSIFRTTLDVLDINVVGAVTDGLVSTYNTVQDAIASMKSAGDALEGGEAMANSVEGGIGFAVDGIAWVPIAGWIIKAAWAVGKFIKGIVEIARSAKDYGKVSSIYPDWRFSPTLDNQILNNVIEDLAETQDWSRRFGPPALGKGQGTKPDYWLKNTESGGKELSRKMGRDSDGIEMDWQLARWTGMIPGGSTIVRGARIQANSASLVGPDLMPSAQKVLLWVWSSIIGKKGNAGPAMYTIDTDVLRTWSAYIGGMHEFIHDTKDLNGSQKEAVMKALNKDKAGNPIFGWGTSVKPKANEHDNYHPIKQADALEKRQVSFLDTLLTAYIDENYAAIKNDSSLRSKWEGRKRDLLEHPARCDVDLDNVPDRDYRDELRNRGAGHGVCTQAATSFAVATKGGFGSGGGPDANPFAKGPKTKRSVPKDGIGFVPLLALGVGAYYAYRKGYLKGLPLIG